jgi:hypothetical protein
MGFDAVDLADAVGHSGGHWPSTGLATRGILAVEMLCNGDPALYQQMLNFKASLAS